MNAMSPLPKDHPMMVAWEAHKATEDYANSLHWALRVMPMLQAGAPEAVTKADVCGLMPLEQRTRHVEGSMWAAFLAGWDAANSAKSNS